MEYAHDQTEENQAGTSCSGMRQSVIFHQPTLHTDRGPLTTKLIGMLIQAMRNFHLNLIESNLLAAAFLPTITDLTPAVCKEAMRIHPGASAEWLEDSVERR